MFIFFIFQGLTVECTNYDGCRAGFLVSYGNFLLPCEKMQHHIAAHIFLDTVRNLTAAGLILIIFN